MSQQEKTQQQGPAPIPDQVSRGILLRWVGWFGLINGLVFSVIALRYVMATPLSDSALAWSYMLFATLTQFSLLATLPLFLIALPLVLVFPRRRWISLLGILIGALSLTALVMDTTIYEQYRYHMSMLTVVIFETSTWVMAAIILLSMLAFQTMLAGFVWRKVIAPKQGRPGVWVALVLVLTGLVSQGMHIWADATSYVPVTQYTRVLPLYYPMKAKRDLVKWGLMDEAEMQRLREINRAKIPDAGDLNYPLQPLQCSPEQKPLNILYVVVDAMRRDHIDSATTPVLASFAEESLDFTNHYSGGNSSRMGFFSMFYGLPSTYWQSFYASQTQPVLMEQLVDQGYQMGLFSAVGFGSPSQIDRTVFAGYGQSFPVIEGSGDAELSRAVTAAWQDWIGGYEGDAPFFGFLYFDPGSDWEPEAGVDESDFTDAQRKQAGYRRGMSFVDAEIARALQSLEDSGRADNTLVIIASDHGYEFDELGLGYIGHASNYSDWQLKSTLMMRWPGKSPQRFTHRSAHRDLPVTLLQDVLGCANPPEDYASGKSLFDTTDWDWIVAGSYNSHAIVQPDTVVITNPGGFIEVLGEGYRPHKGLRVDPNVTQDVMLEMRRFYQ